MPDFPYGKDYPEEDFFDQDGIVPSSWSADRYGMDRTEAELDRRPEDDDDLSEECSGQLRMAHRLAVGYRDRLMYVEGIGWHHWDGKRWAFDDGGYAKRAVIYILEQAIAETIGATKDSPLAALRRDVRKCESAFGVTGILALPQHSNRSPPLCATSTPTRICSTAPTARWTCGRCKLRPQPR